MLVNGRHYRTVWMSGSDVYFVDQTVLPFFFRVHKADTYAGTCYAIENMIVRGAGAIGAAAGFGMAQAFLEAPKNAFWDYVMKAKLRIEKTRPTAQNLFYATHATHRVLYAAQNSSDPKEEAVKEAQRIADEDVDNCKKIGEYGSVLISDKCKVNTHCNAGWLAFVDYGTALSPIYVAHQQKKDVFVYVDETRPGNQGAKLTAWELQQQEIPYAIITDSAGAYFMSSRKVDIVIVGADRIARNGDVVNKIGTLEKAIVAKEFNVPFYVAAPTSTFDLQCESGEDIPLEERSKDEILYHIGIGTDGLLKKLLISSDVSCALNPAFDLTPARYITGIITEKGVVDASESSIKELFC